MSRFYKLFIGPKIREIRLEQQLTQAAFAQRIGISTSYFNQIENNQRHVTAGIILALAEEFNVDIAGLSTDDSDRLIADLTEVLADPVFEGKRPSTQEIKLVAQNAPGFVHALMAMHSGLKKSGERLAELDSSIISSGTNVTPTPYEAVRDFFHYKDNYIDELDHAGEQLAAKLRIDHSMSLESLYARLREQFDIRVVSLPDADGPKIIRDYDAKTRTLGLSATSTRETQKFQIAHQIGLLEQRELITKLAKEGKFHSPEAEKICEIGLANYFAGSVILPYKEFVKAAHNRRHDIDALAGKFGASLEQVAHRLSTLQRPGEKGVPFFFAKIDQAGNIIKRHSATKLQFARFGSACPLWNAHQAFEAPNRIVRQLAETPDGSRYLCIATETLRRPREFGKPVRRFALALGCEIKYSDQLVYGDDLDIIDNPKFEPIGVSCRICPRENCNQRAVPPNQGELKLNLSHREILPYQIL